MSEDKVYHLPAFQDALSRMTYREAGLSPDTHQRYKRGQLPTTLVNMLRRHPMLVEALRDDLARDTEHETA